MGRKSHILSLKDQDIKLIYSCIGIVSSLKPHSMAWRINLSLNTRLTRQSPLIFHDQPEEDLCLSSHYLYEEAQDIYRLLHNKLEYKNQSRRAFIVEWATFDYLLLLVLLDKAKQSLLKKLRQVRGLQYMHLLDPTNIRNKAWLMV